MISVHDMTELLYICDAYNELNRALFGNERALGLHEENFASLSRICGLIERTADGERKDIEVVSTKAYGTEVISK